MIKHKRKNSTSKLLVELKKWSGLDSNQWPTA
jgi:hypothetical protein